MYLIYYTVSLWAISPPNINSAIIQSYVFLSSGRVQKLMYMYIVHQFVQILINFIICIYYLYIYISLYIYLKAPCSNTSTYVPHSGRGRSHGPAFDIRTGSLVRTHAGASFVINFASLSPASAWPSLA